MPITQQRMIAVVQAAGDISQAFTGLRGAVLDEYKRFIDGAQTAEQAIANIAIQFDADLTARAEAVIQMEFLRYRLTNKKNTYDRERKRRHRLNYEEPGRAARPQVLPGRTASEIARQVDLEEGEVGMPDAPDSASLPAKAKPVALTDDELIAALLRQQEGRSQLLPLEERLRIEREAEEEIKKG